MQGKGKDHIILALDVDHLETAREILASLGGTLQYVKLGHQLYARGGIPFLREVMSGGYSVFLDLKLHDIPNTVSMAVEALASEGLWALTLHCGGGRKMMEEARETRDRAGSSLKLLGVTVLTSFSEASWEEVCPGCSLRTALETRAALCRASGLDGIVCSPLDLPVVREFGKGLFTVVPGVRRAASADDQARVATPERTIAAGADYIVVGRPVVEARDRGEALLAFISAVEEGLKWKSR